MKKLLTALALLTMSLPALSVTYICTAKEGIDAKDAAYAFNSSTKQFYQGSKEEVLDSGSSVEMIELSDVDVITFRCPHCFTVKGSLMGAMDVELNIRNKKGQFNIAGPDGDSINGALNCSTTEKEIITL